MCEYQTLRILEGGLRGGHISRPLFDSWTQLNSGSYQLGTNPTLLVLWEARSEFVDCITTEDMTSRLSRGQAVKHKDASSRRSVATILASSRLFHTTKCPRHGALHLNAHLKKGNAVSRSELKVINDMFPWTEKEDKQKTNLDLASLMTEAWRRGMHDPIAQTLKVVPIGAPNSIATAMLIAALGNEAFPKIYGLMLTDKACCLTTAGYKGYFKAISTAIRRTNHWNDGIPATIHDVGNSAYFELATGRAANLSDWGEEKSKRVGPRLPLTEPNGIDFNVRLRAHVKRLVAGLMPKMDDWGSWEDFVRNRQRWATSGSAAGARAVVEGESVRINKHSYFETITAQEMLAWLDSPPELRAIGSDKLEPGKSRAIYGTLPTDQAICTYVMSKMEARLGRLPHFVGGHSGITEVAGIGQRLLDVSGLGVECTMLDYADFNYQHTLEAQFILFDEIYRAILVNVPNLDAAKAAKWVAEAQLNQWVKFPNDTSWHRVTQGMFSGVRTTNFTNTALNYCYFMAASEMVAELYSVEPIDLEHFHQGDDVWITNRSRVWAFLLYKTMSDLGFVFQPSKQMFDQNRGEFLRVVYTRDGALGYLMRAVATLIIKPIQSVLELAPQSKATAYTSQVHLLFRRGLRLETCEVLWWALVPHALRLRLPGGGGVGIPLSIAGKGFADGGLDLGPPLTAAVHTRASAPLPAPMAVTQALEEAIPSNMTEDWLHGVSQRVGQSFDGPALKQAVHAANVSDSLRPTDRLMTMRMLERELKSWLDKLDTDTRYKEVRRIWVSGPKPQSCLMYSVEIMDQMLQLHVESSAETRSGPNITDSLMRGLAMSPFRDVAGAKLALKGSAYSAARRSLELTDGNPIAQRAITWLDAIHRKTGDEVTAAILQGIRGVGLSYESWLHPTILSWLNKTATDWAILDAMQQGIQHRDEWLRLLESYQKTVVDYEITRGHLVDWSHY